MLFGGTMPTFMAGRRPLSPGNRAGIGAALVLLAVVSAVELTERPGLDYVGLLAAVPFLAAVFAVWQLVLGAGALATVVGAVFVGMAGTELGMPGLVNLMGIVLATGVAA